MVHLDYLIQFGLFGPIGPFSLFGPFQITSVHFGIPLLTHGKIQVWVESTIDYLSNINCNYMINFGYHSNLLQRMRI